MSHRIISAIFSLCLLCIASMASAVTITIDPGNLSAKYRTDLTTGYLAGAHTVNVPDNAVHWVEFSDQIVGFHFHVDSAGNIISNTTRATISNDTITFLTVPVNVDPGSYVGQSRFDYYFNGSRTCMLYALNF